MHQRNFQVRLADKLMLNQQAEPKLIEPGRVSVKLADVVRHYLRPTVTQCQKTPQQLTNLAISEVLGNNGHK